MGLFMGDRGAVEAPPLLSTIIASRFQLAQRGVLFLRKPKGSESLRIAWERVL